MAEPHRQLRKYKKRRRRPSLFLRLRGVGCFAAAAAGEDFAPPGARDFCPRRGTASGGHISFCEERNVEKKVA